MKYWEKLSTNLRKAKIFPFLEMNVKDIQVSKDRALSHFRSKNFVCKVEL